MNTAPCFEVPNAVPDLADKSIRQARQALHSFISTVGRTAQTAQGSAELAR